MQLSHMTSIEALALLSSTTSQWAELTALTPALTLAKALQINIYSNSKYAFHIFYSYGAI